MFNPEGINWTIDKKQEQIFQNAVESFLERNTELGIGIGIGRTAQVTVLEEDKTICMKAVVNKDLPRRDVEEEMLITTKLYEKGYSVPRPVFSVKTEGNDFLFLETIRSANNAHGMSLSDLVEKDKYHELPSGFDFRAFFGELKKIIGDINNKENIYHRDLHLGQVMINKDNLPTVIDFGEAEEILGSEDPFRRINSKGEIEIIHRDDEKVMEMYREVGKYLEANSYFNKREEK